uniref:hypothetical protein n=1 Tax=Catenulispora rubra TaxID=280293 RepID=UPI0018924180
MRKYLSFAAVALSSGGAFIAAAGAAHATTATDNWRAAPWLASSPVAVHGMPFDHQDTMSGLCGMQRDKTVAGTVSSDLVQKLCAGTGDMDLTPPVPGPPPMGNPPPCTVVCPPSTWT